ncbi:MAG: PilZ domain-containing protein [Bacteroidota bacterium]
MKERRDHYRYSARWRVAVICDGAGQHDTSLLHGVTGDVSLGGANILTGQDCGAHQEVIILLDVPPVEAGAQTLRLQIGAWATYSVLDPGMNLFRSGLRFDQMAVLDHQLLARHLASHFAVLPIGNPPSN